MKERELGKEVRNFTVKARLPSEYVALTKGLQML